MPTKPIYFGPSQESGAERLAGAGAVAVNVVIDSRGVVRRRPGIAPHDTYPTTVIDSAGVHGLHVTEGGRAFAFGAPNPQAAIYRLGAGSFMQYTGLNSTLAGTGRPVVAETDALLVIASGRELQKIVLAGLSTARLGGDPPLSSHVIANALRLIANDTDLDRSKARYSDLSQGTLDYSGHESWTFGGVGLSGFFTAEARPDPVLAIGENTNEVFVWGTSSVQVFAPDGATVYAPVSTREYGIVAPYSPIKNEQGFAWLDHRRRFVLSDGREHKVISSEIQQTLDDIAIVSDCHGYRVRLGPVDCLVWTFPSDGRTFAYQMGGGWAQWQGPMSAGAFTPFTVTAHHHDRATNTNIVGTSDGYVGQLAMGRSTDLEETIAASITTGYQDRETSMKKWCKALRLTMKRGTTTSATAPVGLLSYSDAPGMWSAPLSVSFGISGETTTEVEIRSLGTYRRRAWRFEFSGDVDLALVRVEEDFEVLGQ
jgi:hypothetical protein